MQTNEIIEALLGSPVVQDRTRLLAADRLNTQNQEIERLRARASRLREELGNRGREITKLSEGRETTKDCSHEHIHGDRECMYCGKTVDREPDFADAAVAFGFDPND
jgi:hypothetical protein